MSANYKLDLKEGSELVKGVSNVRYDSAVRRAYIVGLTNAAATPIGSGTQGNTDLADVISTILNDVGPYHHVYPTLPLAYIRAKRYGATKAWADLIYRRYRITVPAGQVKASYRTTFVSVPWYRLATEIGGDQPSNLPSGPINGIQFGQEFNAAAQPLSYQLSIPSIRMYVPTVLVSSPMTSLFPHVGRISAQPFSAFGDVFPKWTLRFDGMAVNWVYSDITNASTFEVQYAFTGCSQGFYRMSPFYGLGDEFTAAPSTGPIVAVQDSVPQADPSWHTVTTLAHPAVNFPTFPTS